VKLTVLGSGTGFPSSLRGGPGYLVQSKGASLVMDLGMGTLSKLHGLGISLDRVGPILISHLHPDHVAELVSLLFALKNIVISRRLPLELIGAPGLQMLLEKLQEVHGSWIRPEQFTVHIREMERGEVQIGDLKVVSLPVLHTEQSVGFRLTDLSGRSLAYSGDSDSCPALIELVRDVDLAVMECSFPDGKKCAGHLTPSEVGKIVSQGGAKKVVLSHFYPECEEVDVAAQCRRHYGGEVLAAEDLMELTL
jgi:ribonuclease BN (tRNA processing enzyme)